MDSSQIEAVVCRLQDLREAVPDLELVVLFGSTAKGRRRRGSDVDVAVRCAGTADLDTLHALLAPRLGSDRLDLVDLRRAGPLLAMEVARSGRPLYESRPGTFRQFQSLASRRYCDTAKLRRAQRRAIHAFLARHDLWP
jgi:predicted nucleotidyltransferase